MMPVSMILPEKTCEIDIVLDTYDYSSAKHHFSKVIDILNNP